MKKHYQITKKGHYILFVDVYPFNINCLIEVDFTNNIAYIDGGNSSMDIKELHKMMKTYDLFGIFVPDVVQNISH